MKKEKWIKEIVGEVLMKHGFSYERDKYDKNSFWHFVRKVDGKVDPIEQRITIEEESLARYFRGGCALHLLFKTSAYGSSLPVNLTKFLPKECLPEPVLTFLLVDFRYWVYETEDEFKKILVDFIRFIEEYGLDKLAELSIEKEAAIPTNEMGEKLISSYESLNEIFIQKYNINADDGSRENVCKWFKLIEQKIMETKDEPYENVKDMLLEMTAFLGEQLLKGVGGRWDIGIYPRVVILIDMNTFTSKSYGLFGDVIGSWRIQNISYLKENYLILLEGKLPVSPMQKRELSQRRKELNSGKFKFPFLVQNICP